MEQVQSLQSRQVKDQQSTWVENLLSAEMVREIVGSRLPWRAHQRVPLGAHVQSPYSIRRQHGPRVYGSA